jgi:hypothetical protein
VAGDEVSFLRRKKLAESEGYSTFSRRKKSLGLGNSKSEQIDVHTSHSMFDFQEASVPGPSGRPLSDANSNRVWSSGSLFTS